MSGNASNLRARKANGNGAAANGNGKEADSATIAAGKSSHVVNYIPTAYGQAMDKKLDQHQTYEFGGPIGVSAMMLLFPVLMCELRFDDR
jgi:delta24(24(1))-sterol reductase